MQKIIAAVLVSLISYTALAQKPIRLSKTIVSANMKGVPAEAAEIYVNESPKQVTVTAKGILSNGVKGCSNCNVAGKITYVSDAPKKGLDDMPSPFASGVKGIRVILGKEPTGSTRTAYIATTDAEGYFGFKDIPSGSYSIILHDQTIAKGLLVTEKPKYEKAPARSPGSGQ